MTGRNQILFKSIIKPFYKENAFLLALVFTMMFFVVNKLDGAELLEYHYSLIVATLKSFIILGCVFCLWFAYARKCFIYVSTHLKKTEFSYLHILNSVSRFQRFKLFVVLQFWLLLPIILYAVIIVIIGFREKYYLPVSSTIIFFPVVIILSSLSIMRQTTYPDKPVSIHPQNILKAKVRLSYPGFLLMYITDRQKLSWIGYKIFNCGLLYLIASNNTRLDYEVTTLYLFFSFGILAHAALIFRIRAFEKNCLSFYRALPFSITKRFSQYAFFYALLLIPELIVSFILTPVHLHFYDALGFSFCSFGLLLVINSLTFTHNFGMKEFLKILLLFFFIQYVLIMVFGFLALFIFTLILSFSLFYFRYLKFESVN